MAKLIEKIKNFISNLTSEIEEIPENAILLDVRNPNECARGTIEGSVLIPLSKLSNKKLVAEKLTDPERPIVVYCASGGRAVRAKKLLKQHGYQQVYNCGSIKTAGKLTQC